MRSVICCVVCPMIAVSVFNFRSVCGKDLQYEFAYTSNRMEGQTGIYLHSRDGERFVSAAFTVAEAPSWAPDGKKIEFQAKVEDHWDIYVMDLDTAVVILITYATPKAWLLFEPTQVELRSIQQFHRRSSIHRSFNQCLDQ